ncbi:hypothetical protein H3146_03225 [Streptomyces sp. OF3]|uniref:Uncharacterized protein n=1 Tax=Streptomyces alkaliterrae TaxID=2213162 RepID=A0A7W3ZLG7_9ACTN|nr:hypothetical protein [Streptomyces alkaliterrae]
MISACWLVIGVGYAAFAAFDEPGLPVAPLLAYPVAAWCWTRRRDWRAVVAAAAAGAVTMFGLLDVLRPDLGRFVGDAFATGFGATAALTVFALVARVRARS